MNSVTIPMPNAISTTIQTSPTWVIVMINLTNCLICLSMVAVALIGLLVDWLITPTGEYVNDAPYRYLVWIVDNSLHRGRHARRWTHPTIWWSEYPQHKHML